MWKFLVLCSILAISAEAKSVLKSVKNCDGFENAALVTVGGTSPDQIPIPGEVTMDLHCIISQDLPADLIIKLDLEKQDPFPLEVPCLNGLGSCEYDLCEILVSNPDSFCTGLPEGQPCGCPLLANDYDLKGVKVQVPDFGILNNLMVGSYKARGTFYGASNSAEKLGCIEFDFEFVKGKSQKRSNPFLNMLRG